MLPCETPRLGHIVAMINKKGSRIVYTTKDDITRREKGDIDEDLLDYDVYGFTIIV